MASHPSLRPGVETLTITDAAPGTHLRVETVDGDPVVTLLADHAGNAHVTFIPDEHAVLADSDACRPPSAVATRWSPASIGWWRATPAVPPSPGSATWFG